MSTEKPNLWAELRKPFPSESVGKLPRGGLQLDYVGHAAVTDRLLQVDPEWSWEPAGRTEQGLPALDAEGNLWIRLTVCGVTRLGVGDGKNMKERVGDALRNAAMRFGVALDLWTKEELESHIEAPELKNEKPSFNGSLMWTLKGEMAKAGIAGDEAISFSRTIIGKDKPLNDDDINALLEALRTK